MILMEISDNKVMMAEDKTVKVEIETSKSDKKMTVAKDEKTTVEDDMIISDKMITVFEDERKMSPENVTSVSDDKTIILGDKRFVLEDNTKTPENRIPEDNLKELNDSMMTLPDIKSAKLDDKALTLKIETTKPDDKKITPENKSTISVENRKKNLDKLKGRTELEEKTTVVLTKHLSGYNEPKKPNGEASTVKKKPMELSLLSGYSYAKLMKKFEKIVAEYDGEKSERKTFVSGENETVSEADIMKYKRLLERYKKKKAEEDLLKVEYKETILESEERKRDVSDYESKLLQYEFPVDDSRPSDSEQQAIDEYQKVRIKTRD